MKKVWWLLAALALVGVACSFSSLLGGKSSAVDEMTPAVQVNEKILFQDDFSDTESGWDRVKGENGSLTDYVDGRYRILVNDTNTDIWANPGKHFTGDIVVEVDAVKNGGPDDNDFGVLCRYQDVDNYYGFYISSDGYVGIARIKDGDAEMLTDDGSMFQDDAIAQGSGALNHIKASCVGDELSLTVNGKHVLTVHDSTFTDGDVGLIAGTFDEPGADILFDNFVVRRP